MFNKTKVYLKRKSVFPRLLVLTIFSLVASLVYNSYIVPNNVVYGGMSGLAIIINKLFPVSPVFYMNILSIITLLLGFMFLGFKETGYGIIGYLIYTLCINITAPFSKYLILDFDSRFLNIIIFAIIHGTAFGFIYRTGFNTAGADTLVEILKKYRKKPIGYLSNIINGIIIICGLFVFGFINTVYAIMFLIIYNVICDYVLTGSSIYKICFIKSKEFDKVVDYLSDDLGLGYTVLDSTNGIGFLNRKVIFCVVPSLDFLDIKKKLVLIDKNIDIVTNDCYSLDGGTVDSLLLV